MRESVVPFAPVRSGKSAPEDSLDQAGQSVMGLLQEAAVVARQNSQHALDVAHKLSLQLRAAEDRIRDLEADVRHYHERASRAEQWLLRISRDIEKRFFDPSGQSSRQQNAVVHGAGLQAAE